LIPFSFTIPVDCEATARKMRTSSAVSYRPTMHQLTINNLLLPLLPLPLLLLLLPPPLLLLLLLLLLPWHHLLSRSLT
jgi:hypothetical protein